MLTLKQVKDICEIMNEYDYDSDWGAYEEYSGRAMYGKTCHGFECKSPYSGNQSDIAFAMMEYYFTEISDDWHNALEWTREHMPGRYDSLGLGKIYY